MSRSTMLKHAEAPVAPAPTHESPGGPVQTAHIGIFSGTIHMEKTIQFSSLLLILGWLTFCMPAQAEPSREIKRDRITPEQMERLKNMTPEERRQVREKMREHRQKLDPQERAARREALRERWQGMSPEERAAIRKKLGERAQNIPPEERAAKRRELRERWQNMNPEERQRLREDFKRADRP